MIEVVSSGGISLDLSPGAEFSLEMENPIFSSDTVPAAFSTQITFAPTDKNCGVFGYLAAMMLAPQVKTLEASLYFNGLPLISGKLIYEGIEEGDLNYTFTAVSYASQLEAKIYDTPFIVGGNEYMSREQVLAAFIKGLLGTGYHAPVMIDQNYTETEDSNVNDVVRKYINYPYEDSGCARVEMPAIDILKIWALSPVYNLVQIKRDLRLKITPLCIVGQYRLSAKKPALTTEDGATIDLSTYLPDVSYLDVFKLLCGIFCAHLYQDGRKLLMLDADTLFTNGSNIIQLDEKISDSFSSGIETGKTYHLGWEGETDNTYNIENLDADLEDGDVFEVTDLHDIVLYRQTNQPPYDKSNIFRTLFHPLTGQVFSAKDYIGKPNSSYRRYLVDSVYLRHEEKAFGDAEDSYEIKIPGAPVKTIPVNIPHTLDNGTNNPYDAPIQKYRVAPVVTIPDKAERGKDLLVGVYGDEQLCDLGIVIDPIDITDYHEPTPEQAKDKTILDRTSLSPADLFEAYHRRFAEWMARDRQTVTVGLYLTATDVATWRLFNRFYFRGRMWLCKKLTVTFAAGVETMESEGEFVEL